MRSPYAQMNTNLKDITRGMTLLFRCSFTTQTSIESRWFVNNEMSAPRDKLIPGMNNLLGIVNAIATIPFAMI